jgi:hypothetical protein
MATTTRTVTYEEWLNMPVVEDAIEEVVNGEIRIMPPKLATDRVVTQGHLSPKVFPGVAVDVSSIWPD